MKSYKGLKKDYWLFWVASSLGMGASNILQYVLSLYVLDITGSATVFASMLSIIIFPRILLTPLANAFFGATFAVSVAYLLRQTYAVDTWVYSTYCAVTSAMSMISIASSAAGEMLFGLLNDATWVWLPIFLGAAGVALASLLFKRVMTKQEKTE